MEYHFKIHRESKGYWAECVELEGCVTQADSIEELDQNMAEALSLYLDEPADSKLVLPLPRKSLNGRKVRKVPVPANVAFAFRPSPSLTSGPHAKGRSSQTGLQESIQLSAPRIRSHGQSGTFDAAEDSLYLS